jgi:hypothetical protein
MLCFLDLSNWRRLDLNMETVSTLLRSTPLLHFSGPLLLAIVIGFFWWRSGSIYILLERVWRIVAGKMEVSDPVLKEFIQENRELEKFRFMYGLMVGTKTELHKLLEWLRENSIEIGTAQRAKRWIDTKDRKLIPMPKHYLLGISLGLVFCMAIAMVCLKAATSHSALLQMKGSKVWFLAEANEVRGLWGDWSIDQSLCVKDATSISGLSGFTPSETSVLCDAYKNNTLGKIVSDTVRQQQVFGLLYGILALIFVAVLISSIASAAAAKKIKGLLPRIEDGGDGGSVGTVK